jgi:outer membrane receptor protein involved in Fe transport
MFRAILLLTAVFAGMLSAQESGAITGAITDHTGAAVPGARVTVTETATHIARTAITDTSGGYVVPSLRATRYTFAVEAAGFKGFIQNGVLLQANQSLTLNAELEVGESRTSVTVAAEGNPVDTSTSTLNQVVDATRMIDMPLNGRNAAGLTTLVAGAIPVPGAANGALQTSGISFPSSVAISTNGSRANQMNYQLDGGNNNDGQTNVNQPFPFPDALQEFSVQTSNYTAQYGSNAGGVVNVVTKSGANAVHGDVFEFVRNAVFNARNWAAPTRDQLKRNQFGGTIGGPLVIPHLYHGKNKTFFFGGYQATRIRNIANGLSSTLPTPAMIGGDFSALLQANNPGNPLGRVTQLKDPATGQPIPGNIVPASRLDPASLKMLTYLPIAQEAANGLVRYSKPNVENYDEFIARVDHNISGKDTLNFRYYFDRYFQAADFDAHNLLILQSSNPNVSQNLQAHESHIFRPNLLNDFRFTFSRVAPGGDPPPGMPDVRDFGVTIPFQPNPKDIQNVMVPGFFSLNTRPHLSLVRNSFDWTDDMSWVRGRHSIRFGVSINRNRVNEDFLFQQAGIFNFNGSYTGTALTDFLFGKLFSFTQGSGTFTHLRDTFLGTYLQDDIRVSRRLTLNLGVRYEPFFPWTELNRQFERFVPQNYFNGVHSTRFTNAPAGLLFPGDPGMPDNGTTGSYHNFAPRAGFAWDIFGNGKTSLRGGGGMFYDSRENSIEAIGFNIVLPYNSQIALTPPPGPFSNPLIGTNIQFPPPNPPPSNLAFPAPVAAYTYDPATNFAVPVTYNWNLTLEHQLPEQWLVRAAYVGSHGSHLPESQALNPAVYIPGSTVSVDQRRIFKGYGNIQQITQDINSSFHSLQLTLEKRLSHNLSVLASYTFARALDDLSNGASIGDLSGANNVSPIPWNQPGRHQFDHGPTDFDRTQNFVVSYVWQLPNLAKSSRAVRMAFGNWQTSGIWSVRSGLPFTVLAGPDTAQTGLGNERAVLNGAVFGPGACANVAPCANYLLPGSFTAPANGGYGNLGKNSVRGPGTFNWDMGLFKNFPIREKTYVQFRAEFFNVFNQVNKSNPVATVTAAGFGSIRAAAEPRIGQLALKLYF